MSVSVGLLKAENRIKSRLQSLGLTAQCAAKLAGIPASRLNLALNNLKDLRPEDAETLLKITQLLQEAKDSFLPLPLDCSQPEALRTLLGHMERNNLTPEKIREIVNQVFAVNQ